MRFAQPLFIYAFLVIAGLSIFYFWIFTERKKARERFAQKELLKQLSSAVDPAKQRLKAFLIVIAVAMCLFTLLRPQWGFQWQEVKRRGVDIIIALDTSKSMLAQDVKPSRLERSKLAVSDFIKNIKGDRIGLVAFAGSAFLECPLTVDYGGFLLSLDGVSVNTIPRGGTSISSAIREAVKSFVTGQKKYKVLIIITDGEDHEGDPVAAAREAAKEGIVIYCIGIGTKEGELLTVPEDGQMTYLKDSEGNVIKSRLDERMLEKIALSTGGSYVHAASTEFGLDLLYRDKISKMEKRELEGKMAKNYEERFQIPLGVALALLLIELLISDKRKGL